MDSMSILIGVLKMANERKNKNRAEFLERIRKSVMSMKVMELTLKEGGITAEELAKEFKSFRVNKLSNRKVLVEFGEDVLS